MSRKTTEDIKFSRQRKKKEFWRCRVWVYEDNNKSFLNEEKERKKVWIDYGMISIMKMSLTYCARSGRSLKVEKKTMWENEPDVYRQLVSCVNKNQNCLQLILRMEFLYFIGPTLALATKCRERKYIELDRCIYWQSYQLVRIIINVYTVDRERNHMKEREKKLIVLSFIEHLFFKSREKWNNKIFIEQD